VPWHDAAGIAADQCGIRRPWWPRRHGVSLSVPRKASDRRRFSSSSSGDSGASLAIALAGNGGGEQIRARAVPRVSSSGDGRSTAAYQQNIMRTE